MLKRADYILMAVLSATAISFNFILGSFYLTPPARILIHVNGNLYKTLSLEEDGVFIIEGNSFHNSIQVQDKSVRMLEADCPDKICIRQGAIAQTGSSIVCLPNKIVIEIEGTEKSETDIDAVAK